MTGKAKNKKRIWLCVLLAGLLVLLLALAVVLSLSGSEGEPPEKPTTEPTVPTTLPPPPENTLGPEDFVYDGGYLTCTAAPSILGIDVSSFQGNVDWETVREAGVSFVMIRVGGRGYGEEGGLYSDKLAQVNYQGAKAAGLDVGAYFFSQAISVAEAKEEALYTLQAIEGWELDMPVVFDWERMDAGRTAFADPRTVTDCMVAFCEEIETAGYRPMVYFNPDHSDSMFYIEEVTDYDFWLAMYTDWMTYPYQVDMWQYTKSGTVAGIQGQVDINLYFPEA